MKCGSQQDVSESQKSVLLEPQQPPSLTLLPMIRGETEAWGGGVACSKTQSHQLVRSWDSVLYALHYLPSRKDAGGGG